MNIWVCIKQVPDTACRLQLLKSGDGVDESGIEWILNPYDEFALEEALRIKDKNSDETQVRVISQGPSTRVEKALRTALAMGADQAFLVDTSSEGSKGEKSAPSPGFTARALSAVIKSDKEDWDFVFAGKSGVDHNHSATGPMLSEFLNIPHAGFVTSLEGPKEGGEWLCRRSLQASVTEEIRIKPKALITMEKGINEPRYPSLPGILRAKKKPLQKILLSDLKLVKNLRENPGDELLFHSYRLPAPPPPAQFISGTPEEQAQALLRLLKEKEKICLP